MKKELSWEAVVIDINDALIKSIKDCIDASENKDKYYITKISLPEELVEKK